MPGQLLLLNPAKRRKARRKPAKRRASVRRRSNPIFAAPKRRARRRVARRSNPIARRSRRSYRRNPISLRGLGGSSIMETLKNAGIGGAGALAVDMVFGQLAKFNILPASASSKVNATGGVNPVYYGLKAAAALFIIGGLGSKVLGRSMATKLAAGSLTVMGYELLRSVVPPIASLPLGYYNAGRRANVGAYVNPGLRGLGAGRSNNIMSMSAYVSGANNAAQREGVRR